MEDDTHIDTIPIVEDVEKVSPVAENKNFFFTVMFVTVVIVGIFFLLYATSSPNPAVKASLNIDGSVMGSSIFGQVSGAKSTSQPQVQSQSTNEMLGPAANPPSAQKSSISLTPVPTVVTTKTPTPTSITSAPTATSVPESTATPVPTNTPTSTPPPPVPTNTPAPTYTPTPTETLIPTPTDIPTPTPTTI